MVKRVITFLIIFLIFSPSAIYSAEEKVLYVQSIKAPVLEEPIFGAKEIAKARRGEALQLIEKKDRWFRIRYKDLTGWVSALFVDTKPPAKRISVLEGSEKELKGGARRRASAFVTAAAARGLMEERARLSDRYRIDPEGVKWVESIVITDEEALRFLEEVKR